MKRDDAVNEITVIVQACEGRRRVGSWVDFDGNPSRSYIGPWTAFDEYEVPITRPRSGTTEWRAVLIKKQRYDNDITNHPDRSGVDAWEVYVPLTRGNARETKIALERYLSGADVTLGSRPASMRDLADLEDPRLIAHLLSMHYDHLSKQDAKEALVVLSDEDGEPDVERRCEHATKLLSGAIEHAKRSAAYHGQFDHDERPLFEDDEE